MDRIAAFLAIIAAVLLGTPAFAQDMQAGYGPADHSSLRTVATESWVEEWDPATGRWVRIADEDAAAYSSQGELPVVTTTFVNGINVTETRTAARYAVPVAPRSPAASLGRYGPFIVTSPTSAAMVGSTDSATPRQFDAMLRDFPQLAMLELVEAPGTSNDIANLAVGRRIRAAGIATHVPRGGSVRSGAVELFLAGAIRTVDDGAQFAVHSWLDNHGREPDDFATDHPAHRLYLDYYIEMGMSEARARDFYAMTNSVPHATALWLASDDMRYWLRPERAPAQPMLAEARVSMIQALTEFAREAARRPVMPVAGIEPAIVYTDLSGVSLGQLAFSPLDSGVALP